MKLSEKIEAMFWAFNDAHRIGEARRLAFEAQMLEVELEGLRAMEEKLKEPSLVLDTGLDAKRFTAQPGELKPVPLPYFQVTPEEWEDAGFRELGTLEVLNKVLAKRRGAEETKPLQASTQDIDDLRRRVARLERDNTFLWQGLEIDSGRSALSTGLDGALGIRKQAVERDGG